MKKIKYFNFATNGTNRHEQQGNMITKVRGLFSLLCATAIFFTGCFNFDERPEDLGEGFVAVERIDGVPTSGRPHGAITTLSGTVVPEHATNKKIEWSIASSTAEGANLDENRLTTNGEGIVKVTAVIKNGLAEGEDFTEHFDIEIFLTEPFSVKYITGIPDVLSVGDFTCTLNGKVSPTNATYKTISWSVINPGTTGAVISSNTLTATSKGTVKIRATIENGLLEKGDFTQDFSIIIPRTGIYVVGDYGPNYNTVSAILWKDGERTALPVPAGTYRSSTAGIVYANGNQYIAGYYAATNIDYNNNRYVPCYWVNGERKTLTPAVTYAETRSIAVDPVTGEVYILGRDATNYNQNKYCYWKVDEDGQVGSRVDLTGNIHQAGDYVGHFAVYDGEVYIPYSIDGSNYYWDKNGTANQITVNGSSSNFIVRTATGWNGRVYFAGNDFSLNYDRGKPLFFVKDGNNYTVINMDIATDVMTWRCQINSIIIQNGVLVLYGYGENNYGVDYFFSWNMAENKMTFLPDGMYSFDTSNVVFSDGDVFITTIVSLDTIKAVSAGGYRAIVEGGEHYFVPHDAPSPNHSTYSTNFTGIAVKP